MQNRLLSIPQQNTWNMRRVFNDTTISNIGAVFKIFNQTFDPRAWKEAINLYIENNDAVRIRINEGLEVTQSTVEFEIEDFEVIDLSDKSEEEKQIIYNEWVKEKLNGKLYKFRIIKFSENESGLYILKDHVITDAFSEGLMMSELTDLYISLLKGEIPQVKKHPSYECFLDREDKYRSSEQYVKDKEYFMNEFIEEPVLVGMSYKKAENLLANRYSELLSADFTNQLKSYCSNHSISEAVFFETLIFTYLKIISDENKITIGMPVLNRAKKSGINERMISGMFVNTLPFSVEVPNGIDFKSLSKSISNKKFSIFKHQQYPFADIQNDLKDRFGYNGKIFDVVFSFQNASIIGSDESIKTKSEWIPSGYADSSMLIHVDDRDGLGQYTINLEYQTTMFELDEVKNILARLKKMASQIFANPNITINELNILSDYDMEIYKEFNHGLRLPVNKTVVELFEEQVQKNPYKTALIFDGNEWSYSEVNMYANSLCATIKSYDLPKNSIIPIVGGRSYFTIIAMLAIAKAGYAYTIPFADADEYPKERVDSLMEICNAKLYISYGDNDYTNPNVQNLNIYDEDIWSINYDNPNTSISLKDPFVILQTSGSSGIPKAVVISHEAAANMGSNNKHLIEGCNYGISLITMTFDAFTMDVLTPLLNGKTLVLSTPDEQKSMSLTYQLISKYPKSFTISTPTKLKYYLSSCEDDSWQNVDSIVLGGETFGEELIDLIKTKSGARLYNLYGPTETTVFNSGKEIIDNNVTLGRPTANFDIFILNKNNQVMPMGVIGEIVPVGIGVADGYIGDEKSTLEHFISINDQKAYKTGDQGAVISTAELIYCGRKDNQYKINGVRFEAGEIEKIMNLYPGIILSGVALKKHNDISYVVAYYESNENVDIDDLTDYLELKLPLSIVPSFFLKMDKLPVTSTGKLASRDKLPDLDFDKLEENRYVAPENETQEKLCHIWQTILNKKRVGVNSTWKSVGGGSLEFLKLQTVIKNEFGINILPSDLPRSPTIIFLDKIINGLVVKEDLNENYDVDNIEFNHNPKENNAILITGATGYLGSHILYSLLKKTNDDIYCLVRDFDKFNELMKFYFKEKIEMYQKRIHLIKGDMALDNLGLSLTEYEELKAQVATVVNAAANVKHYGPMDEFKGVNVIGVYNLLKFCAEANAKMHHVSTISVSGQGLTTQTQDNVVFTEKDLNVGQNYKENIYIWTKYVGEKIVRDFQAKGLQASVYRAGFITNRNSDNLFQYNADNSGFKLLTEAVTELGVLPPELEAMEIQSVTVDDAAEAITTLINGINKSRTYHIYDGNVTNFGGYLTSNNIKYELISAEDFMIRLEELILINKKYALIQKYFTDMASSASNNTICNDETMQILSGLGFYYQVSGGGSKDADSYILHLHTSKSEDK